MKQSLLTLIVLVLIVGLSVLVVSQNKHPPVDNSFETLFNIAGKPIKTLDRSFTKLIGVNVEDERALGDILAKEFKSYSVKNHADEVYLNQLIQDLAADYNPKDLNYRVFVVNGSPNAFALPGGVIGVTTGLLDILESEAELVAILGHEKGHIDLGHCIDMMRNQAKRGSNDRGDFLENYFNLLLHLSFSKFQETESDRYGFETTVSMGYDPHGMGRAHGQLLKTFGKSYSGGLLGDYFKTHPSSQIREENWREKAIRWYNLHPLKKMYDGKKNFNQRVPFSQQAYEDEWVPKK